MATSREGPLGRTAKLCARCSKLELLDTEDVRVWEFVVWIFEEEWPALNGLKQSAAAGCQFCEMIRSSIISSHETSQTALGHVKVYVRSAGPAGKLHALRVFVDNHLFVRGTFLLYTQSSAISNMFSAPTKQVLSERNVGFIQKCIAESTGSVEAVALELPTRLVDIADLQRGRAKLVLSTKIPRTDDIKYAALSYCWGSGYIAESQSITTFSNQDDRQAGFEIKDLSPVIKDAIEVCSRINIRYLWVDALCILQAGTAPNCDKDKEAAKEDWNKESEHLWATFRGAYITICAASSTNCQESFLRDRPMQPGLVVRVRTTSTNSDESPASPTSSPESPAYEILSWPTEAFEGPYESFSTPFQPMILKSRWYSRGWVHQEISFSRRLLIFGTNMLYMRCGKLQAWENGWRGESRDSQLCEMDSRDLEHEPFRQFAIDVKAFYNKETTVETDRLPAIAGLASQVAGLTKSQYLAGLWRSNLANDLLYSVGSTYSDEKMPFDERTSELSAPQSEARPSWSWAGHRSNFKRRPGGWRNLELETNDGWTLDCVVLEAVAEVDGESPFGVMKHAHLLLRCRMIALERLLRVEPWAVDPSKLLQEFCPQQLKGMSIFWDTCNDSPPVNWAADISFICIAEKPIPWLKDRNMVGGLVIYPAEDGGYYRIGVWGEVDPKWWAGEVWSCVENHRGWETQTITLL